MCGLFTHSIFSAAKTTLNAFGIHPKVAVAYGIFWLRLSTAFLQLRLDIPLVHPVMAPLAQGDYEANIYHLVDMCGREQIAPLGCFLCHFHPFINKVSILSRLQPTTTLPFVSPAVLFFGTRDSFVGGYLGFASHLFYRLTHAVFAAISPWEMFFGRPIDALFLSRGGCRCHPVNVSLLDLWN